MGVGTGGAELGIKLLRAETCGVTGTKGPGSELMHHALSRHCTASGADGGGAAGLEPLAIAARIHVRFDLPGGCAWRVDIEQQPGAAQFAGQGQAFRIGLGTQSDIALRTLVTSEWHSRIQAEIPRQCDLAGAAELETITFHREFQRSGLCGWRVGVQIKGQIQRLRGTGLEIKLAAQRLAQKLSFPNAARVTAAVIHNLTDGREA